MRIIVFGATGRTGAHVIRQALERGHVVTAFVRAGSSLPEDITHASEPGRLKVVTGDVFDPASVRSAVVGHDAAVCALGSRSLSSTTVRSRGTATVVDALQAEGVPRLLVVSAMGTGESWNTLSFMQKLFYKTLLRASRADHEAQEAAVRASELRWTIFRPSGLTEGPVTGSYALGPNATGKTSQIARADVAHAIVAELDAGVLDRQAVTVTN